MAPAHSDDESASVVRANKKSKKVEEEPMDVDEEEEQEGSEEESEYEIECILDAKRGSFPEGRIGYFVKWKGYDESENSWVDEKDAGNAHALIEDYWKRNPKKSRKSMDAKTPKKPRKSVASAPSEEPVEISTKKRGRKSTTAPDPNIRDEEEVRAPKKAKKNGAAKQKEVTQEAETSVEEEVHFKDMAEYMAVPEWEHLVETIDTIERNSDGTLTVYFSMVGGQRIKEDSKICSERFPQKMIKFYESNLRWKSVGDGEEGS